MLTIHEVNTNKDKKDFIKFIYQLYKDDTEYRDLNIIFIKNFLYKQDAFAKRCVVTPIQIKNDDKTKLQCIFIIDDTDEIKLSFLEFVPNARQYFEMLQDYSYDLLTKYGRKKVVIGINGHISYGLGILTDEYNHKFEFNANYNKKYYTKELDEFFPVIKKAYSYRYDPKDMLRTIEPHVEKYSNNGITFRYLDLKEFERDMLIFGELCHESLKDTPYYATKNSLEMYELMLKMKRLIRKEDIIFAMKDGKEIGFIYTHPDYAEFFNKPKINNISIYFKNLTKQTKSAICNIIGVLPEYQSEGVGILLIDKAIRFRISQGYTEGTSSFVLEDNIPSTKLSKGLSVGINKEFHLYEFSKVKGSKF